MRVAGLAIVTFLGSLLISGGPSNTLAMDVNGRYFALGVGSRSCGDFIKFREKRVENFTTEQYEIAEVIMEHWVAGYLTAHNFYVTDTYDVVGVVTMDQLKNGSKSTAGPIRTTVLRKVWSFLSMSCM